MRKYIEQMVPALAMHHTNEFELMKIQNDAVVESAEVHEVINCDDSENESMDAESDVSTEEFVGQQLQIHQCKDLIIFLKRIDEIQSEKENGTKQNHALDGKDDGPPPKKVRFADEFGEDLIHVKLFGPFENGIELDVESDVTESEENCSELAGLNEVNMVSTFFVENIDQAKNIENMDDDDGVQNAKSSDDTQNLEIESDTQSPATIGDDSVQNLVVVDNAQNPATTDNTQNVAASNQKINLSRMSSTEENAYQKIMRGMKATQKDVLDFIHNNQLEYEALNVHLARSQERHDIEVATIRAQNEELRVRLNSEISEHKNAKGLIFKIQEDHAKELETHKQKHKLQFDMLKSNEKELKKQLTEMMQCIDKIREEKANCEEHLNQKYLNIIDKMRKDTDQQLKCKGCDKALNYCSPICEKMW